VPQSGIEQENTGERQTSRNGWSWGASSACSSTGPFRGEHGSQTAMSDGRKCIHTDPSYQQLGTKDFSQPADPSTATREVPLPGTGQRVPD
jgi:hypothetical protein